MNKSIFAKTIAIAIAASFLVMAGNGLGKSGQSNQALELGDLAGIMQENSIDIIQLKDKLAGVPNLAPPIGEPNTLVFMDSFEDDILDDVPDDPPWVVTESASTDYGNWGPDDFEDDIVGSNPDAPWQTVDGSSLINHWETVEPGWEDGSIGTPITETAYMGLDGWFGTFGGSTLQYQTPAPGAPSGSIVPGLSTGTVAAEFIVTAGTNYFGPVGIGSSATTHAYIGGWIYPTNAEKIDILIVEGGTYATIIEVALYDPGTGYQVYHYPGGAGVATGVMVSLNTWHEYFVEYDETTDQYTIWFDGNPVAPGSAFVAPTDNIDGMAWFVNAGLPNCQIDNFCHFEMGAGGTHMVDVVDTWSFSGSGGAQSVYLNQNNEVVGPASTSIEFPYPYSFGEYSGISWAVQTGTSVANTNGATFLVQDYNDRTLMAVRFSGGMIQYNTGGTWTDLLAFTANTEYWIDMYMDCFTKTYMGLDIDYMPYLAGGETLANQGAGIAGFRAQCTLGTQSEIFFDDVERWGDLQDGTVRVTDVDAHNGAQSVRMWEGGGDTFCDMGAYMGGDGASFGEFYFWFEGDGTLGGGSVYLMDTTQTFLVTIISIGADLTVANVPHPGEISWIDGDGSGGGWVIDGPSFTEGTWNNISIKYDIGAGTFEAFWNGVSQGTFGILEANAPDAGIVFFFGEGPAAPVDIFIDDVVLTANQVPAPPTNSHATVGEPTGLETWDNYTTDQDNPIDGTVIGTEANTHGPGSEDIKEVALGDVPDFSNYTVDQDIPIQGIVTNTFTNIDEIYPLDGLTEDISEVIGLGGSTWLNYSTDMDSPVNGTVTGTEANTYVVDGSTQDITEIRNGGDIWANYTTALDIPVQGIVTGTEVDTHVLDATTENIQEVFVAGGAQTLVNEAFNVWPAPGWNEAGSASQWIQQASATAGGTAPEAYFYWGAVGLWYFYPGPLDTSGMPSVTLQWNNLCDDYGAGVVCKIQTSSDAVNWQDAGWQWTSGTGNLGPGLQTLVIATSDVGSSTFYVSFTVDGDTFQLDWWAIDDVVLTGTAPDRYTCEHKWQTEDIGIGATSLELSVTARTNTGSDDTFSFAYSLDNIAYLPTGIIVNSDVMNTYTFLLPATTSGQIYLKVVDVNRNDGAGSQDTIFIDEILLYHYINIPFWQTLEHRWRTQNLFAGADKITLYVTAATNVGSDDTFTFGYATAVGGPYTATTLTVNSDIMATYSVEIPASLSGQIYIRVMDNNEADPVQQDTILIDQIRIERQVGMSLEHVWRTEAIDINTLILELFITARTNTGSDDSFTFGYSDMVTGPYTSTGITVNSDIMTTYSILIPFVTTQLYINVIDDNTIDLAQQDSIIIDAIRLESTISSATMTNQVARAEIPDEGTVTGTYVLTTSIPPDGSSQQIEEIPLSKKKSAPSPAPMYTPPVVIPIRSDNTRVKNSAPSTALSNKINDIFSQMSNTQPLSSQMSGTTPLSPGPQPGIRATVLSEDFSAAWIPSTDGDAYAQPPGGWDVDGICTSEAAPGLTRYWSQFDDGVTGFPTSNSTPYAAGLWWSNVEPVQDEWLISPSMDLSGSMNTMLYFNAIYTMPSYGAAATAMDWVSVSTDGGMSWINIGDLAHDAQFEIPGATGGAGGAGWCWYEMYLAGQTAIPIDLSAFDFMPDVRIAFHYDITNTAAFPFGIWAVDDVHVEAEAAGNSLAHVWAIDPQPADSTTRTLFITARTDAATTEGFTFGWSQNAAGPFTPAISVDSDVLQTFSAPLPTDFSGDLYINVIDNIGSDFNPPELSSIFVDCIRVFNDNSVLPECSLEHRWRTESIAVGAQSIDLHVTARTNTGADDTFTFGYSTVLGGPYTPVLTVNSDVMNTYSAVLPYYFSGQIYLNVVDNLADWSQPGYTTSYDTIYIDDITIEYFTPGGSYIQEITTRDRYGHGNVTGTHVMTQSLIPDSVEQEIEEVDLALYPGNKPSGESGSPIINSPGPGPSTRAIVLEEDFTDAWIPSTDGDMYDQPPGGWDVDGISTGENAPFLTQYWSQFNDAETGFATSNDSLSAAGVWWSAAGVQDEWLITPPLDLSASMNTRLFFNAIYTMPSYGAGADEHVWLKVSVDGGFSWTPLADIIHDTPTWEIPGASGGAGGAGWCWYEMYLPGAIMWPIDLSAYDFQPDVRIAWQVDYAATGNRGINCIDDVHIDAEAAGFSLAHAWEMDLQPNALTRTLHMNAHTNVGPNDDFSIGYCTDIADTGNPTWLFDVNSNTPTDYTAPVPVLFNGEFYVVAWDTNAGDTGGPANADTLYVDTLYMDSFQSAGSTSVDIHWDVSFDDYSGTWATNYTADQDNPFEGTVTNTYTNTDEINPLDGLTEDITEVPIGMGTLTDFTVTSDINVQGTRTGSYLDIDEISPPDGNTENIQETLVPGGTPILIDEDFATNPGWTITHTAGTAWTYSAANQRMENTYGYPNSGYLDSPVVDCSGVTGITLQFWHLWQANYGTSQQDGYVRGSIDGGSSWPYLIDEFHHNAPATETAVKGPYALAWADGQSQVMIRYDIYNYDDWYWDIDDVLMQGTAAPEYSLEHKWTTESLTAVGCDLYVMARHNTGSDDTFSIEYSTDDIAYFPTGITINSDVLTTYSVALPVMSGSIYLRVVDDTTGDGAQQDTVFIELIRLEQMIGGDMYIDFLTDLDIPSHGTVTGTHVDTHVLDGSTQNIQEIYLSTPGGLSYYVDRAAFDGDAGPLPIEDFEDANIGAGAIAAIPSPLDATTNNAWFVPGDILPGIRFQSNGVGGLALCGANFNGNPTITVCTDTFTDSMDMIFYDNDVYAVGMDLQSYFSACTPTITLYTTGDVVIDTVTAPASNAGTFWGVISDQLITRINIADAVNTDGGDNIAFGTPIAGNSLAHAWRIEAPDPGATAQSLIIDARTNTGADDSFTFEYSEDGIAWNPTGITVNTDVMTQYSCVIPMITSPLYLRVSDDTLADAVLTDTIYIDQIRVEWFLDVLPQNSLDHRWRTQVIGALAQTVTLHVTARTNTGADDMFSILYSPTLGGPAAVYTPTGIVISSDVMTTYSVELPWTQFTPAHLLYIQAKDTNEGDIATADTLYIDAITIEYTGYLPGSGENDIVKYNVYRADEEDGDSVAGPYDYIGSTPPFTDIYVDAGEGIDLRNQAWYYVEAEDSFGQTAASGYFSKLNFPPVTSNVLANGTSDLEIGPGAPNVLLTADVFDDSSTWEAIPKIDGAEWYDTVDPGEGAGTPMNDDGDLSSITEPFSFTLDTSLWLPGSDHYIYVRGHESAPGNTGSGWGLPVFVHINVTASAFGITPWDISCHKSGTDILIDWTTGTGPFDIYIADTVTGAGPYSLLQAGVAGMNYTHVGALIDGLDHSYYITSDAGITKSNLGFKLQMVLADNLVAINWIALPYKCDIVDANGLMDDINADGPGGNVVNIATRWNTVTQGYESRTQITAVIRAGLNFAVTPGAGYQVKLYAGMATTWNIVGAAQDKDMFYVSAPITLPLSDNLLALNWIALPYNSLITDANGIMDTINAAGTGGNTVNIATRWNTVTQGYESRTQITAVIRAGLNFAVTPGAGFQVKLYSGFAFTWTISDNVLNP